MHSFFSDLALNYAQVRRASSWTMRCTYFHVLGLTIPIHPILSSPENDHSHQCVQQSSWIRIIMSCLWLAVPVDGLPRPLRHTWVDGKNELFGLTYNYLFIVPKFQSIIRHLWKKDSLLDSIRAKRFHYSLDPMFIDYEGDFDARILSGLEAKGHVTKNTNLQEGISAVTAISKAHHILEVATDPRRNGSVVTF